MTRKTSIKKQIAICIIFFLLLTASTCNKNKDCPDGSHGYIEIKNNSSKKINWRHFTPDSVYTINGSTPASDLIIDPNSSYKYGAGIEDCWEATFKEGYSSYFLIFDNDTVQEIGWEAISGTNRGLLKKVKVDLNYLNSNSFKILYP